MVVTTLYIVVGLLLSTLVQMSSSYCMMTAPKEHTDKCIYGGHVLSPGITFTDYEKCEEYRCYEDGSLSICGIGINAGVMLPPGGCTIVRGEKCSIKYVDATDHSIKCQGDIFG